MHFFLFLFNTCFSSQSGSSLYLYFTCIFLERGLKSFFKRVSFGTGNGLRSSLRIVIGLCVIQARGGWKELSGCEVNQVGGTKVQSSSQVVRGQRSRSGSCNCRWRKINATELGAACACGDSSQSLAQGVHTSPRWCCLNTYCSTWRSSHSSPLVQSSAKEAEGALSAISWRTSSTPRESQRK